ncbi:hypothetical protein Ahy_B07g087801 isoform A [Arachis hypogaea]|uniref:ALIX V-shaped domain-containing protein n=1 Tax=Arachis hypogaea TaxID=3818 RepID=A0A444YD13_ARAHY|nr:hypothetical protein Ahy_B07g087801 isoform A [Arachis hypogaea]
MERYGEIKDVFLDGAKGEGEKDMEYFFHTWFSLIHQLQPAAIIFSDAGPDTRWVGNELGLGASTCWSIYNSTLTPIGGIYNDPRYAAEGDPAGHEWVPALCDVSIRPDMVKNKGFLPSGRSEIHKQRNQIKAIINSLLPACNSADPDTHVAFNADAIIANPPAYATIFNHVILTTVCFCLQAQNDEFSALFNLEDYKASREKCYKQIEAAIAKFREIKDNINEGLKFYVNLQDAITNVKQQSNDFVMTRNIQCREMIEDVQRQVAGLSFQDKNSGAFSSSYPPVGSQNQRPSTQQTDPHPQTPYYQPPEQPPVSSYGHPPPSYGSAAHQPPPPYHIPPTSAAPYQPHQVHQQAPAEYGQPAYPRWRGPYYNARLSNLVLFPGLHIPFHLHTLHLIKVDTISSNSVIQPSSIIREIILSVSSPLNKLDLDIPVILKL